MGCECWNRNIREEHQILDSQADALKSALEQPSGLYDRKVFLHQLLRSFGPRLESHLWKEEQVFFPALRRLLGRESGRLDLLLAQHEQLREHLRRLTALLEGPDHPCWDELVRAGNCLVDLLEEHEEKEGRFLLEILDFSLQPKELMELARKFREAACQPAGEAP